MARPTRGESFINELERHIKQILDDTEVKATERIQAINAGIKLIDIRRGVADDQTHNFFGPKGKE